MELSYLELKEKEIINVADGKKLGRLSDLVLTSKGAVIGVVVPGSRRIFKGGADGDIFIPWTSIFKIGDDVILVELGGGNNLMLV
ncbi:MAG: YlmC/YmxH family sporulation protein [Clostridiales bacterium]|jgi:YlmC/YmxH family sporulation protein|nr:YlmC/YmxH family sporulation protein [Clostridiales bacterium]